jgi:hypothetical protein
LFIYFSWIWYVLPSYWPKLGCENNEMTVSRWKCVLDNYWWNPISQIVGLYMPNPSNFSVALYLSYGFYFLVWYIFLLRLTVRKCLGYFVWKNMILCQKIIFFPIAEGGAKFFGVFRVKYHDFMPKNHIFCFKEFSFKM